jgi:hypothetical protein
MMERLFSAPVVVAIWGGLNTLMVGLLIGFVASGFGPGLIAVEIYASAAGLVFLIALLTWLARRRRPRALARGLTVPPRPATMLMLAVAFALLWLGLPFGEWVPIIAALPLAIAAFMELYARRGIRKLPAVFPAARLAPVLLLTVRMLAVRMLAVEQRQ